MINAGDIISRKEVLNAAFLSKTDPSSQTIAGPVAITGSLTLSDGIDISGGCDIRSSAGITGSLTVSQNATVTGTVTWSGGGSANANAAYTHINNDGTDHSFIDQDVKSTASPDFVKLYVNGNGSWISGTTINNAWLRLGGLGLDGAEIAFSGNGTISCIGGNELIIAVGTEQLSFSTNGIDIPVDIYVDGAVTATSFSGIRVQDLPLKRWRKTKSLTGSVSQNVSTLLTAIDATWTDVWDVNSIVMVIVDGEVNAPGIDYTLGATNTLTFTYDLTSGTVLDIIVF